MSPGSGEGLDVRFMNLSSLGGDAWLPAIRTDAGWFVTMTAVERGEEPPLVVSGAFEGRVTSETTSERVFRFDDWGDWDRRPRTKAARQVLVLCRTAPTVRCSSAIEIAPRPRTTGPHVVGGDAELLQSGPRIDAHLG